jgi:hypothetical protein
MSSSARSATAARGRLPGAPPQSLGLDPGSECSTPEGIEATITPAASGPSEARAVLNARAARAKGTRTLETQAETCIYLAILQ